MTLERFLGSKEASAGSKKEQDFLNHFPEFEVLEEHPEKKGVLYICKKGVGRSRSIAQRANSWGKEEVFFLIGGIESLRKFLIHVGGVDVEAALAYLMNKYHVIFFKDVLQNLQREGVMIPNSERHSAVDNISENRPWFSEKSRKIVRRKVKWGSFFKRHGILVDGEVAEIEKSYAVGVLSAVVESLSS